MVSENTPSGESGRPVLDVTKAKFALGQVVITANAQSQLQNEDVMTGLNRHVKGDWGELDESDRLENERSVKQGYRLLSSYTSKAGIKFWIITEHDRSVTTVLLPEDY